MIATTVIISIRVKPCCVVSGQPWGPDVAGVRKLNVSLPTSTAFCSYVITAGAGTGTNNPVAGFTFTSPAGNWYYIVATCDMDADGVLATFWTSSVDSTIQKQNEGE